ncbi:MobQ family relaxase [Sporosarcina sp. NPDC096371]|uniref:MobQ family relaxase n=1 Tax=Sporosarcina sp. NPDC096371 TaxID=3364530 RepID=UPI003812690E
MAIYHFSAQVISRGKGQSAVAAAAYRSGDKLQDERTGEEKFYRRDVTPDSMILAPSDSPEWVKDRERLWNAVEKIEKRKDSQLAREINIALPVELSNGQQKELIRDFVQKEFVDKGMIADLSIHRDDANNPHVHVMLTTREISADGFGPKNRSWNDKGLLEQWRAEWANHANKSLEREGVQEKISHLSHEARGLEQLPTIHLGHIASAMEKRGIDTPQGDINRDRQEYNGLVVDLQKYREEKRAIEEEMARQLKQFDKPAPEQSSTQLTQNELLRNFREKYFEPLEEQQPVKQEVTRQQEPEKVIEEQQAIKQEPQVIAQRFTTQEELAHLQEAKKVLKADPSLRNIQERRQQIAKWSERLNNGEQFVTWSDKAIKEAAGHYNSIAANQEKIQEQQQKLESINWLNPLKVKENRATKERAEMVISDCLDQIQLHDKKLNYHREKLKFSTEVEFNQVKADFETKRPGLLETNKNQRQQIVREVDVLRGAEKALKNGFVRKVASNYPEHPEAQHMSFETAQKLNEVNKKNGKVVPIQTIEEFVTKKRQEIKQLQGEISHVNEYSSRLLRAGNHLKNYEKNRDYVEKIDKNPILKAKMLVSKSARSDYDKAVLARDQYADLLKDEGITKRTDFNKQESILGELQERIPVFKERINTMQRGLGIFDSIMQGLAQAGDSARRDQGRQQVKDRGKDKKRQNRWEMER